MHVVTRTYPITDVYVVDGAETTEQAISIVRGDPGAEDLAIPVSFVSQKQGTSYYDASLAVLVADTPVSGANDE